MINAQGGGQQMTHGNVNGVGQQSHQQVPQAQVGNGIGNANGGGTKVVPGRRTVRSTSCSASPCRNCTRWRATRGPLSGPGRCTGGEPGVNQALQSGAPNVAAGFGRGVAPQNIIPRAQGAVQVHANIDESQTLC